MAKLWAGKGSIQISKTRILGMQARSRGQSCKTGSGNKVPQKLLISANYITTVYTER